MSQSLFYTIFRTELGWMGVLGGDGGLKHITLPQNSEEYVFTKLGKLGDAPFSESYYSDLAGRFQSYFSGMEVDFPYELDFSESTSFQRSVWEAAMTIPYGRTRSYGWVAAQIGKPQAARAVGQALGANPFPVIVPCHRVLAGDGSLHGFAGGLELKARMLGLESARKKTLELTVV